LKLDLIEEKRFKKKGRFVYLTDKGLNCCDCIEKFISFDFPLLVTENETNYVFSNFFSYLNNA